MKKFLLLSQIRGIFQSPPARSTRIVFTRRCVNSSNWKVQHMSTGVSDSRGGLRLAVLSSLVLAVLGGCSAEQTTAPDTSESEVFHSSAVGSFTLECETNFAIQCDGFDDRINLSPEELGTPASVTVEAWARIDQSGKIHFLVTNAADDFNDGFSLIITDSDRLKFVAVAGSNNAGVALGGTVLEAGRWYHVAGVYDAESQQIKVFVDGSEDGSGSFSHGILYSPVRDLRFGMQNKSYGQVNRFLKGGLDEVRIWDHAKTAGDLAESMDLSIDSDAGLLGYWPMDEGKGTETADVSGAANNGLLERGPAWIETTDATTCAGSMVIDVKPGGDPEQPKPIMLNPGKIPVAILSASDFIVADELDVSSITFGKTGDESSMHYRGNGRENCSAQDVNEDGYTDLVCHFVRAQTGLEPGDTEVILKGMTHGGMAVSATDEVLVKE